MSFYELTYFLISKSLTKTVRTALIVSCCISFFVSEGWSFERLKEYEKVLSLTNVKDRLFTLRRSNSANELLFLIHALFITCFKLRL